MAFQEVVQAVLKMDASQYQSEAKKSARATENIGDSARKASRRGSGALQGLGKTAAGVGQAAKTAFLVGGAAATAFLTTTTDAAADLAESQNAVQVVFGDAADQLEAYGKTAATSVGLAQQEFNELATNSGALLTNFGFTQAEAAEESINLTERAADMASVFNTDVGDALFAVQAALRGETEPARRFGVSLDAASIKARAVSMGLASASGEISKNAKAQAALSLIYEQTNQVAGDFANTSGSLANQQRILAAEFQNAKAEIGQAMIPVMQQLVGLARDMMPAFVDIGEAFGDIVQAAGPLIELLGRILPGVLGAVADYISLVADGASALGAIFGDEASRQALRFAESLEHVEAAAAAAAAGTGRGQDTYDAFADSILHLAESGSLTTERLQELADAAGVEGDAIAGALATNLDFARTQGFAADQVRLLEDELLGIITTSDQYKGQKDELIEAYGLEEAAARAEADAANAAAEATEAAGDAAADATGGMEEAADGAQQLHDQLRAAADAQESLADVLRAAADPAFAAVQAYQQYQATLQKVDEDGERTAEEQLELAEAVLKAQGALDAFTAGGVEQAAEAIATALGISREEAAGLLEELGILDGKQVTAVVNVEGRLTGASRAAGAAIDAGVARFGGPRQHGGPVRPDEAYVVGEAGKELFIPDAAGQVVPLPTGGMAAAMAAAGANMSATPMRITNNTTSSSTTTGDRNLTVNFVNPRLADNPMDGVRNALALDSLEGVA